jgi:uncharacterized protein YndB with AHSA1/START domain
MIMRKSKFMGEYEINASPKMLFPYLNTAAGLSQWFADDVNVNEDKIFTFVWDGKDHKAKVTSQRTNAYVKFEFLEDKERNTDNEEENQPDPSFIEFKLDTNELTQSLFVKVTDYSDTADEEEMEEIWDNLIYSLRELVGG